MSRLRIMASFYRGGTSRGLLFRDGYLAHFTSADRDRIICHAMGSPDPDGRQINGLGGGASSLSKAAIVSKVGSKRSREARLRSQPFPGLSHLDDSKGSADVVYRFGQVSIREESVDWGSTCGNMIAAAAHFALEESVVLAHHLIDPLPPPGEVPPDDTIVYTAKVRLFAHDTGKIFIARVPVQLARRKQKEDEAFNVWLPTLEGNSEIAGVPGTAPGIIIESPLEGSVLSTGNERDTIEVDGEQIDVSVIDAGLPVVFVSASSLGIPLSVLLEHPAAIDSNTDLMAKLERIRQKACTLTPGLQAKLSPPSPKLCVVHPRCTYTGTGGSTIAEDSMDVMARVVSTGQLHRTIPATTLSAMAASTCFPNSIVSQLASKAGCAKSEAAVREAGGEGVRAITVGQPAGTSSASVQTADGKPTSIVMLRTAKMIMRGSFTIPPSIRTQTQIQPLPSSKSASASQGTKDSPVALDGGSEK